MNNPVSDARPIARYNALCTGTRDEVETHTVRMTEHRSIDAESTLDLVGSGALFDRNEPCRFTWNVGRRKITPLDPNEEDRPIALVTRD